MLTIRQGALAHQQGVTLLEVLITIVILAFGLLGLAGLQSKIQLAEVESFQRAQAIVLLSDMAERIAANGPNASSYVSATPFGTGDSQPASCAAVAAGASRDICDWSNALKGAAETKSSAKVGAMQGARGCVVQIQAPNAATGVCSPGIYQVAVVWQGMGKTVAPSLACGQNSYGDDKYRRAIASRVVVPLSTCSMS